MGGSFLGNLSRRFSKTGRRLARKEKAYQKAQQKAQIASIDSELGFRAKEDPREQSALNQSMFGRGLGKSTIATQGKARLTDIQARRKAALLRQKDLAHRGLSLIKLRARAARRTMPFDIAEDLMGDVGKFLGGPGAEDPGSRGTNGLDEAHWSE